MEQTNSVNADPVSISASTCTKWRNWGGFWLLGMCNNFAYVVMLSAAHDILKKQETQNSTAQASVTLDNGLQTGNSSNTSRYDCNPTSTAAVLLADILPTLLIKMSAPFVIHKFPYGYRVFLCALTAVASFLVVSFSSALWMSILVVIRTLQDQLFGRFSLLTEPLTRKPIKQLILERLVTPEMESEGAMLTAHTAAGSLQGVILASISSGLGELSFLALTVYYSRDVVGGWGSGTGGAGVSGALLYSGLTQLGLTPRTTLLVMLIVPCAMILSYFFLLVAPSSLPQWTTKRSQSTGLCPEETERLMDSAEEDDDQDRSTPSCRVTGPLSFTEKLHVMKGLLKFVFPLGLVYFAEYFINQGLMELLYFPNSFLSHAEQYRWYQTLYQVGVFASRSSLCCFKIRRLWVLSLLQVLNVVFLMFAVWYQFLPSAWIVFVIILYEGLLGGFAYVNTFFFISKETEERHREFAMALASVGDTIGICLSTALSFPVHKYFCSL